MLEGARLSNGDVSDFSPSRWEHFPHGADMGIRGFGPTPARAFEQTALAMTAVVTDLGLVRLTKAIEIEVEAPKLDLLLIDWLNALVFEMADQRMVFGAFSVDISNGRLKGKALGETVSRERHAPAVEVKGATFTELAVVEDRPGCWRAQCIIDV
jgi:tRNA nucleotidyltransferase (CCA-adding enzyme)